MFLGNNVPEVLWPVAAVKRGHIAEPIAHPLTQTGALSRCARPGRAHVLRKKKTPRVPTRARRPLLRFRPGGLVQIAPRGELRQVYAKHLRPDQGVVETGVQGPATPRGQSPRQNRGRLRGSLHRSRPTRGLITIWQRHPRLAAPARRCPQPVSRAW